MEQENVRDWTVLLGGRRRLDLGDGLTLRLLSAMEVLEARREAGALAREGRPVFESGQAALEGLQVEDIAALARRWARISREENPSPEDGEEVGTLKKAWSTRLMRAFSGVCSGRLRRCPLRPGPGR